MVKFILGEKLGMTRMFNEKGWAIPITVVRAAPNVVVQVKTEKKDGYDAVQVGAGVKRKISKALKGHYKGLGDFRFLREFKADKGKFKVGDNIDVSIFSPGDIVKASGVSKGKGFAGGMKRHGFSGMPASHGHKHVKRHIGSIGQRFPQHTLKGKKMPGRMGGVNSTVKGLHIVVVDVQEHLLGIYGAIPGSKGALLEIVTQ